jgi:hypothetical protein
MKRTNAIVALAVAAAMPVSGCATTHLSGMYQSKTTDVVRSEEKRTLAKGNDWLFFWGLVDTGSFNLDKEIENQLRSDECVTNLDIKDRLSVGGVLLWIITAGIVSHHSIVATGQPGVINRPVGAAPVRERETIIVPAPAPAGYPRSDKSADYNSGFRDGMKDREAGAMGGPPTGHSKDYEEGYRDALKDTSSGGH